MALAFIQLIEGKVFPFFLSFTLSIGHLITWLLVNQVRMIMRMSKIDLQTKMVAQEQKKKMQVVQAMKKILKQELTKET